MTDLKKCLLTFLILVGAANFLYSQRHADCRLLTELLRNDDVRRVFHLDLYKGVPIIFVDAKKYFDSCQIGSVFGRPVKIVHDSSLENVIDDSNIIIMSLVTKGNMYRIELYHKIMEAYGHIEFRKKRNKYVIKKVLMGNF
jgi:hypothetical protein